ncbi:hypothetical protein [Segetibacter koreensis]|uniref:hypothetical protein n=1 Tax=Segetibacter koreensis TaxID=398037 RepID=UPI00037B8DB6|nr:hypothetical protein [Segetibacter koreensis]
MYIIRDIFQLKFGHFRDAKALLSEATKNNLLPNAQNVKVLSDFTGDSYRLILEEQYNSLAEYEQSLTTSMKQEAWQNWYSRLKDHILSSHREILKEIDV